LERARATTAAEIDHTFALAHRGPREPQLVDGGKRTVEAILLRDPTLRRGAVPKFDLCLVCRHERLLGLAMCTLPRAAQREDAVFGQADIDRDSKAMTVSLKDIQGTTLFRQEIAAKGR
jgi:hypothetical protein